MHRIYICASIIITIPIRIQTKMSLLNSTVTDVVVVVVVTVVLVVSLPAV